MTFIVHDASGWGIGRDGRLQRLDLSGRFNGPDAPKVWKTCLGATKARQRYQPMTWLVLEVVVVED